MFFSIISSFDRYKTFFNYQKVRYFINLLLFCIIFSVFDLAAFGSGAKIMVLPFDVETDSTIYRNQIPQRLKTHLKDAGAEIVESEKIQGYPSNIYADDSSLKEIGIKNNADYVISGKFVSRKPGFSLELKTVGTKKDSQTRTLSAQSIDTAELPKTIKELAKNIITFIFEPEFINEVKIEGNRRIEAEAIKRVIKTEGNKVLDRTLLSEDIRAIYDMGYFEKITAKLEKDPDGRNILTFKIEESKTVRYINIEGNKAFSEEKIKKNLTIKRGEILNVFRIKLNMDRIWTMYKEKNYHHADITYKTKESDSGYTDITFIIDEGEKAMVRSITFYGNSDYTSKKLKKHMKTDEKGFFSFFTSSGEFDRLDLEQDILILTSFYHNSGYIEAKIAEPDVKFDGEWIDIDIEIYEGARFKVGKADIDGELLKQEVGIDKKDIIKNLGIFKEEYFNEKTLRDDVIKIQDIYSNYGYANVDVRPLIDFDRENLKANIVYKIVKNEKIFLNKIIITGNQKTRDKVIRRQLEVAEQEIFSRKKIKESLESLRRLDYFKNLKITPEKVAENKVNLKVDIEENSTGAFVFGGGYSNYEDFFGMVQIAERNFLGRGQNLALKGKFSGTTTQYTLSFTEPWLFDFPLHAGFDLYDWETEYDTYDKDSQGGKLRLGYRIFRNTSAYISYGYDVSDIVIQDEENVSNLIADLEGRNIASSITTSITYDTRNRFFNPTKGVNLSLSVEYAGLGGTIGFIKTSGQGGVYIPIIGDLVGFAHVESGYISEVAGKKLPDYERFYLGGMQSMRGFEWMDIYCLDDDGKEIGGDKFILGNIELLYPLIKDVNLMAVAFYDTGNVFNNSENIRLGELRESAGFGIRWYSPLGPLRLERGYILDPDTSRGEDSSGTWQFTIGYAF